MPAPLVRSAQVVALLVGAALAVVGALALRWPGLVTVLVTAGVVGTVSAGLASEVPGAGRGRALDTGGRAAGWTAGVLLVLAGVAALAGAVVALLVAGVVATAVLTVHLRRAGARSRGAARSAEPRPAPLPTPPASPRPVRLDGPAAPAGPRPSVGGLSARALGEEWLRTTALLEAGIDPARRRSVADRRAAILDELERRDGAGFARWLADTPSPGSNPADHVRDLPAAGTGAP